MTHETISTLLETTSISYLHSLIHSSLHSVSLRRAHRGHRTYSDFTSCNDHLCVYVCVLRFFAILSHVYLELPPHSITIKNLSCYPSCHTHPTSLSPYPDPSPWQPLTCYFHNFLILRLLHRILRMPPKSYSM